MDGEKYAKSYHEFYCPLCCATLTTEIYFPESEKGSYENVKWEKQKEESYRQFMIRHYRVIHGVDFPERIENDT